MSSPDPLILATIVFAATFAVLAALALRVLSSTRTDHEMSRPKPRRLPGSGARAAVRTVLRVLSVILIGYLIIITIAAFLEASPDDGTYLIPGILVVVTLMAAGYLHNMDQRLRMRAGEMTLRDDLLRTVQADMAAKIGTALLDGSKVEWSIAAPEVYSMGLKTFENGRSLLAAGKSLEEVCRAIEPQYDGWDPGHQQAYQSVVRAALEHGG